MTDQKALGDAGEGSTPDDVATLYSWANLHGAKYRDFSSSRALAREEARLRVEEAQAAERQRKAEEEERKAQEEAQLAARLAAEAAEAARQAEAERLAEIARQAEAERQAVLTAQEAQRQAAQQRVWQPPPPSEGYSGGYAPTGEYAPGFAAQSQHEAETFAAHELNHPSFAPTSFLPESPAPQNPMHGVQSGQNPGSQFQAMFPPPGQAAAGGMMAPSSAPPMAALPKAQAPPEQGNEPWHQSPQNFPAPRPQQPYGGQQSPQAYAQPASPNAAYPNPAYPMQSAPVTFPAPAAPPMPPQSSNAHVHPAAVPAYPSYAAPSFASTSYPVPSYPVAADPYMHSPWPTTEQREMRDPTLRPAWLAPELPTPVAPAVPVSASSMQAQYSAGTMASPSKPTQNGEARASDVRVGQAQGFPAQGNPAFGNPALGNPALNQPASGPAQGALTQGGLGPVEDTLLGSRDRIASRWYALKSVFDPHAAPVEQQQVQAPARVPVMAVFSLAGGVGKTSIVAALGRALSSRGERVLLVDTATYGLLPFFFGARDQRPGQLRTFNPPTVSSEAPIQLVTLDPDGNPPPDYLDAQQGSPNMMRGQDQDWLLEEIGRYSRGSSRILVDLPTASGATTRRILRMGPVVLVPVVPDMSSVVSVSAIETFFRNSVTVPNGNAGGKPVMPYYVLNQFDYSLPLHLDVREILREQIGDRLLPFALRRNPAISEALAEGMTVMDYAPTATVAEDYASLAGWVRGVSAPAAVPQRGVRWSER